MKRIPSSMSRPCERTRPQGRAGIYVAITVGLVLMSLGGAAAQVTITGGSSQVTTHPAAQFDPSISGDIVVYTDLRNGPSDIYFTNLDTGTEAIVTGAVGAQQIHDVSGDTIVYTDSGSAPVQVWAYDVATATSARIAPSPFPEREPTISGTLAAFEIYPSGPGTNADVAVSTLSTGTYSVIASTSDHEGRPVVGGDLVVFERGPVPLDPNGVIVVHDLTSGTETVVGSGLQPHTDGTRVAWWTGGFASADIIVLDMTTGSSTTIAYEGAQTRPRLSGDVLAFDDNSLGTADIVLMHLPSGATHRIGAGNAEFLNDVDGNRLAYTSNETGNFDIFVFEFEVHLPQPVVAPASGVQFGEVRVGDSAMQIVTVSNEGTTTLSLYDASFETGDDFSVEPLSLPAVIGPGSTLDVTLSFAPAMVGAASDLLRIEIDGGPLDVSVEGTGVLAELPPSQRIAEILEFFDAAVEDGSLADDGPGSSAEGRREALRNMLKAAGDLIDEDRTDEACQQLRDALERTDGDQKPPDFVSGAAAAELAARIEELMTSLVCAS